MREIWGQFAEVSEGGFSSGLKTVCSSSAVERAACAGCGQASGLCSAPKRKTNSTLGGSKAQQEHLRGSHLEVGELLLLVGDGLLHQHTLDALLHRILLCLERNTASVVTGQYQGAGKDV